MYTASSRLKPGHLPTGRLELGAFEISELEGSTKNEKKLLKKHSASVKRNRVLL